MKKYILFIFAAVLAVGFSSFTTKQKESKQFTTYFYFDDFADDYIEYEGLDACPEGGPTECKVPIEGQGDKQLYKDDNNTRPLLYTVH